MNELAVKLGDSQISLFSRLPRFYTFSNEKSGGPDPDRTGDLLHAMHEREFLTTDLKTHYLREFTKDSLLSACRRPLINCARLCGIMKAKDGIAGGKIGVFRQVHRCAYFERTISPKKLIISSTLRRFILSIISRQTSPAGRGPGPACIQLWGTKCGNLPIEKP